MAAKKILMIVGDFAEEDDEVMVPFHERQGGRVLQYNKIGE